MRNVRSTLMQGQDWLFDLSQADHVGSLSDGGSEVWHKSQCVLQSGAGQCRSSRLHRDEKYHLRSAEPRRPLSHTANAITTAAAKPNQVMAYCMWSSLRCTSS